jgi:hypothetical protein
VGPTDSSKGDGDNRPRSGISPQTLIIASVASAIVVGVFTVPDLLVGTSIT